VYRASLLLKLLNAVAVSAVIVSINARHILTNSLFSVGFVRKQVFFFLLAVENRTFYTADHVAVVQKIPVYYDRQNVGSTYIYDSSVLLE